MNSRPRATFRAEPPVSIGDYAGIPSASWEQLDDHAGAAIGAAGLAVPSVRVGMTWALEHMGCRRHSHHVMVPRFMGRCILNSLNRAALPVQDPTSGTAAVIVVHQFGVRPDLESIRAECEKRSIPYMEDSPFGLAHVERLGPGSMAKFIGLSKFLPLLKGAFVLSGDSGLLEFLKRKRAESSAWSWPLVAMLARLRRGEKAPAYAVLGDVAYELYPEARGDNWVVRGNYMRAIAQIPDFERATAARLALLAATLRGAFLEPESRRLLQVVPLLPATCTDAVQAVFREEGFDAGLYHVDAARNLFHPRFERALLIPINPRIPDAVFERLVRGVANALAN